MKAGGAGASDILSDRSFLPLHEWPRFRRAIRDHASSQPLVIVTPTELGTPLRFQGQVLDKKGNGVLARVYVYQTSAKGWYSDKAAHVSGNSGDERHARLFGYVTCGPTGIFNAKTIRPAGYPESSLPAHIHVEIESLNTPGRMMITEALFNDDPRLTAEARRRSQQEGFVICDVERSGEVEKISAVFQTNW